MPADRTTGKISLLVRSALGIALFASACGAEPAEVCAGERDLRFRPEVETEEYRCFGFDAPPGPFSSVSLVSEDSPVILHHVALYATAGDYPDEIRDCEEMPEDAVELSVWAPGGAPMELPDDVGIALPANARRLVVQAHALRYGDGRAATSSIRICPADDPEHLAAWLPVRAPVPALRPHEVETSTAVCEIAAELHVLSTWPHMHLAGVAFHGAIIRADASREPLVDVDPWIFEEQRAYPVDVTLAAGDAVETQCIWRNDGDAYILPGPLTTDEMCGQSLIAWPAEAAVCLP